MTAPLREKVLEALEKACREEFASEYSSIRRYAKTDDNAVRNGAWAPRVAFIAGLTAAQVRRVLNVEARAGRVLRHEPYPTAVRWWPVGFLAKLQAEQVGAGSAS